MARRRHTLNPAKVKRDAEALRRPGPDAPRSPRPFGPGRRTTAALLAALSVLLLTVSFAPFDVWPLGYVALVPWLCAMHLAGTRRSALLIGWLSGLGFWLLCLYWLTWITLLGYFAAGLYLSVYWLAAAAILRAVIRRRWPMWICLPVVWVALEYARVLAPPSVLGLEFSWFDLALTQYGRTRLIQIADLTGQYGVSFFVAMVNGLAADAAVGLLARRAGGQVAALRPRLLRGAIAVILATALLLGYGTWQLGRDTQAEGPAVGIVQRAYPISLSGRDATPEEILNSHLAGTEELRGSRPDLVLWPETMLPPGLNAELRHVDVAGLAGDDLRSLAGKFFGRNAWRTDLTDETIRAYLAPWIRGGRMPDGEEVPGRCGLAAKVTAAARRLGCPVLAGGISIHRNSRPLFAEDRWVVRNSAVWFDPNTAYAPVYAKRWLVPFSEYVPFKYEWTGLYKLLRKCVPAVMEQLDPGTAWTVFELKRPQGTWRLVSPICYEGTFAAVCRRMVYEGGRKRADILANLSNDGWFVCRWGASYRGSTEHAQHLSHYCFRAVENRVPVIRAVNTGISASIDANGRIVAEVRRGAMRTMISGAVALDGQRRNGVEYLPGHGPKVLVDRRISWYSRLGDVFAAGVAVAAAALMASLIATRPRQ